MVMEGGSGNSYGERRRRRVRGLVEQKRVMVERRSGTVLMKGYGQCEGRVASAEGVGLVLREGRRVVVREVRLILRNRVTMQ